MEALLIILLIIFGSGTIIALGVTAIETWGKVAQARAKAPKEWEERLARLEAEVEELRDLVSELMLEAHDGALLGGEIEKPRPQRLRSK